MHEVSQQWEELKIGTEIRVNGIRSTCTILAKGSNFLHVVGAGGNLEISASKYEVSYLESPDFLKQNDPTLCPETWRRCEQHYGISHNGSDDPCDVRKLAFMILKGDGISCDMAKDVLRIY